MPHYIALIHKDGNVFAEDKITRRALVQLHGEPSFHTALAQKLNVPAAKAAPRGAFYLSEADATYFFFRYHGSTALPARGSYTRIPFDGIVNGSVTESAIEGKVVLVGTINREGPSAFAFTPYSKNNYSNPKLLIHANILDSIISDEGVQRAPTWLNWIVTFGVILLVISWVMNLTPLYGVFATLALATIVLALGTVLFATGGIWMRESQPLVGVFLSYYLSVPYRLIQEYKTRFEYQRKNELLVQVEELKTNFLSLVTHDLKTPVARIQGLAEVLLRKSAARMNDGDRDTVYHIISATDELNRFISSILELNRIESNRIQISMESKDVNLLIERAIESFRAQAHSARIKIQSNLEPLFPIRIDTSLISKVINNLIDNALKYSPPNSEIQIDSREVDNHVEISVTDQGIGMTPEECQQLFTRFYRAKNERTTAVAGTGLGLYLTKYFIEAHNGRVDVRSEKGKGSTFKIFLPLPDMGQSNKEKRDV